VGIFARAKNEKRSWQKSGRAGHEHVWRPVLFQLFFWEIRRRPGAKDVREKQSTGCERSRSSKGPWMKIRFPIRIQKNASPFQAGHLDSIRKKSADSECQIQESDGFRQAVHSLNAILSDYFVAARSTGASGIIEDSNKTVVGKKFLR